MIVEESVKKDEGEENVASNPENCHEEKIEKFRVRSALAGPFAYVIPYKN